MAENTNKNLNNVKREFILNKQVTAESVQPIIEGINEVNRFDDEQEANDPTYVRKPIKLIVDTYGGSIYDGNTLINTIDTSKTPVHGYCYGKAMSMGFAIFVVCHERYAHKRASLMYHDGGTSEKGTLGEIQIAIDQIKKMVKANDEMIVEYTKIPKSKLDRVKRERKNWYMFATDALELGVVDGLIESTRNKNRNNA